jgi:hypothetical protein
MAEKFHGWTVEHGKSATGKPRITLSKPNRSTIWIDRRVGTDPEVALERIKVSALEQEVAASSPDDKTLWQKRLVEAIDDRDQARAYRTAMAGIRAQFPERKE